MHRFAALILGALVWSGIGSRAAANEVVINRNTGRVLWRNQTGQLLEVAAYSLRSNEGGFQPAQWLSIAGNYDADSGGSLDPDSTWFPLGSDAYNLSEATLGVTSLAAEGTVDLGMSWTPDNVEDVTFEYFDVGLDEVVPGSVRFINDFAGDYNANGIVEQSDLDLVLLNWGNAGPPPPEGWLNHLPEGPIDQAELDAVLLNWGAGGEISARPQLNGLFAASVPEPSALGACCAACFLLAYRARAAIRRVRRTS
jgi:hypothetical protein